MAKNAIPGAPKAGGGPLSKLIGVLFLFAALATVIQSPVAAAHFVTSVAGGIGSAGKSLMTFFGEVS
ncbi:hypothetical protein GCM10027271_14640 [Saccharopolyspora gloriosae]|uniref:Uncharacterized protein n=1 Tax=Saccharopolyspora gloriosae TaxID=455344 RepID=A0A840NFG6_9PSEU|nr:hypothetical protein [Saccharopolyspora gloriosae]MBB5067017.1 hypothetical protein [Saccharopolyspora gloriosae]